MFTPRTLPISKKVDRDFQQRVAQGLEVVVRDNNGRYDECFVDRLLECSRDYLKANHIAADRLSALYKDYFSDGIDHINIIRMLKFQKILFEANSHNADFYFSTDNHLSTFDFLRMLENIILTNRGPELSIALSLATVLAYDDWAFPDLKSNRFTIASTNLPGPITNILDIAKHYMLSNKNYHIEESAKYLFASLVLKISELTEVSTLTLELKQILDELIMTKRSPVVYHVIVELFEIAPENCLNSELFGYIKDLLRRAFDKCLKEESRKDLVGLSKCLSKVKIPHNEVLESLKQIDHLEAILAYLTNMNAFKDPSILYLIIYPILSKCDSEDARLLESKLFVTRSEKYFIQKNLQDKYIQQCLKYLKLIMICDPSVVSPTIQIPEKKLRYSLEVALEYLVCNYENPKDYKNLLECCNIIKEGQRRIGTVMGNVHLIDAIFKLFEKTDLTAKPHLRPIFLELIIIVADSCDRLFVFCSKCKLRRKTQDIQMRTIELAFKYDDPDILYEIANIFRFAPINLTTMKPNLNADLCVRFAQLIWDHMLPISRECEHHGLIGTLMALLKRLDLDMPKAVFDTIGIRQHREIPLLIGKILSDFSTVNTVAEKVILCVVESNEKFVNQERHWAKTKLGYLEWLDSETLPDCARKGLDSIIRGICLVIRGECDDAIKKKAMVEINNLISTMIINDDSHERLLKRLIKTGILKLLYIFGTCSLYPTPLRKLAKKELPRIKRDILAKIGSSEEIVQKIISISEDADQSDPELSDQARLMTCYFMKKIGSKRVKKEAEAESDIDRLGLESYLNDILDYTREDWGTSECY